MVLIKIMLHGIFLHRLRWSSTLTLKRIFSSFEVFILTLSHGSKISLQWGLRSYLLKKYSLEFWMYARIPRRNIWKIYLENFWNLLARELGLGGYCLTQLRLVKIWQCVNFGRDFFIRELPCAQVRYRDIWRLNQHLLKQILFKER